MTTLTGTFIAGAVRNARKPRASSSVPLSARMLASIWLTSGGSACLVSSTRPRTLTKSWLP